MNVSVMISLVNRWLAFSVSLFRFDLPLKTFRLLSMTFLNLCNATMLKVVKCKIGKTISKKSTPIGATRELMMFLLLSENIKQPLVSVGELENLTIVLPLNKTDINVKKKADEKQIDKFPLKAKKLVKMWTFGIYLKVFLQD